MQDLMAGVKNNGGKMAAGIPSLWYDSGMTSGGAPDMSSTLVVHSPPILSTLVTRPPQVTKFKDLKSFVGNGTVLFVYKLTQRQCTSSACRAVVLTE